VAYDHWRSNLSGSIQKDEQEDAWIVAWSTFSYPILSDLFLPVNSVGAR
jgi:hypothetical protein